MSENKQYYLQRNPTQLSNMLNKLFVFGLTWSFGGGFSRQDDLDDDAGIGRKGGDRRNMIEVDIASEYDNFIREMFETDPPLGMCLCIFHIILKFLKQSLKKLKKQLEGMRVFNYLILYLISFFLGIRLPSSSRSIYSYFIDLDSGNFTPWEVLVPSTQSMIEKGVVITIGETLGVNPEQSKKARNDEIVQTVDTVRYSFLMALLLLHKSPVLLTGKHLSNNSKSSSFL